MRQRFVVGLAVAAATVVTVAPLLPAKAHVRAGVPGGTVQSLVFRAPVEGADDLNVRHNQAVLIESAPTLTIQSCAETADFTCTVTALQALFMRKPGNTDYLPADTFTITVLTPTLASLNYSLPATQFYSDGSVARWNEVDQLAPHPAPQIRVVTDLAEVQPVVTTGTFARLPGVPEAADLDIAGTATLTRLAGTTAIDVDVSGLEPNSHYLAHLHSGPCADLGPHYQNEPGGLAEPPNELWPSSVPDDPKAGLTTDADGHVVGNGVAPWVARPEARSVFIHLGEEPGGGGGGGGGGGHPPGHLLSVAATEDPHAAHVRIACADLF